MCEKKRRWMNKDDPASRIGFNVWTDFMKYVSPNTKKVKTIDDFIRSADYLGFVKFANYLIELRPLESDKFIQWLFKMGVRLSDWQKPGTYQLYVQEAAKKEYLQWLNGETLQALGGKNFLIRLHQRQQ
jgi:hypothetical protein